MKKSLRALTFGAVVAALYAVLTVAFGFMSYGTVQFRISEALTVLPYFFPVSVVGLTVGCLLANIFSPVSWLDMIVGTAATLIGAAGTRLCRKRDLWFLSPLPPVISNSVIVGLLLTWQDLDGVELGLFLFNAGSVFIGEIVCCYGLGLPLLFLIKKKLIKYII